MGQCCGLVPVRSRGRRFSSRTCKGLMIMMRIVKKYFKLKLMIYLYYLATLIEVLNTIQSRVKITYVG